MAIDTSQTIDGIGCFVKWVSVGKMLEILAAFEPDARLFPNRIGNLAVMHEGECIGYIDFHREEYRPNLGDCNG